jgi:hypothetical protein
MSTFKDEPAVGSAKKTGEKRRMLGMAIMAVSIPLSLAWMVEAATYGRGFISTYLAPIAFLGPICSSLLFASSNSKRRFQFHLSTALAMMLVSAVYVGLNAIPEERDQGVFFGFPFKFLAIGTKDAPRLFLWQGLLSDSWIFLLLLGFTWFVSEWWIRRRAE